MQQSELLIKPQVRVNDLFKKLKVSLPGTNSIQSSESESRGGEISRKRRRDEGASPSSASNPSICLNTEPKKTDPVQVGEKNRSDAQLRRSSRIFEPPKPLNGQRPLDLFGLYAQKLARIPGPPITLERNIDASKLDFNFEFINTYKMQEGVEQVDPNFHAGCDCQGPKCDLSACACLSLEDDSDERIVPYQVGNHGVIVLREDFMRRKPQMIYECSMLCGCGPSCMNRVVEKGRTVSLEIFDTKGRGFGEFSGQRKFTERV